MSQTILIEVNEDLKKIYSLNLNTFVGTDVIHRKSGDDTVELLRILPQVSLVICPSKIGSENTAAKIFEYIKNEGLSTNLIVLGEDATLENQVQCLKEPISWEMLIKEAAHQLGVTLQEAVNRVQADFVPVPAHYFYDITKTPCEVYIRIKKGNNDYQYVKRIHSKDVFDHETIKKYEEQGLKEFFVSKDYIQYFTTYVTTNLVRKLSRDDLGMEERILTTATAHELVRDSVDSIGFEEAWVELGNISINSMVNSVKDSPQVAELLMILFTNKVTYAYQHCHLLALMCHYVLSKQSWYKPEHLETLSFASFFSDVTLKSNAQMQIATMQELEESTLSEEEKQQVLTHPRDAVALLANHPNINNDIKIVMLQSHGKLDGVGIEDDPGEELHPLAKIYVVADAFIKILLNPNMSSTKKDILPIVLARFTNPSYQKIIKALEQKFQ